MDVKRLVRRDRMIVWERKISLLFLAMTILMCNTSCSEQTKSVNLGKSQSTIYLMDSDKVLLAAVDKYNKVNQNVKIEAKVFSDVQEFKNKNSTELLAGNGPDIIVNRLDLLNNINKVMSNGVFYDINQLIAKDKDFKLSDYNEKILDYGVYGGKRYIIPINYINSGFLTTKEILVKNCIKLDENEWTWKNVADKMKKFITDSKSEGKYFIDNLSFTQVLASSGNPFIDYEKKKTSYNSKEFAEILNLYKDIYPAICPSSILSKYSNTDLLKEGIVVMLNYTGIDSPESLNAAYNVISLIQQEAKIFAFPTWNKGDVSTVWPYYLVGINVKCENSKDAFQYIKLILSDEFQQQTGKYDVSSNWYTPVSESAYNLDKSFCLSNTAHGNIPLTEQLASQMDKIRANIGQGKLYESEIYKIIEEELPKFLNGSKSAEETAKIIDDRITIYINE